ncbi:MAG: selenocysteine-specific translation elongation factor [Gemmatimonadota bacterium]|nr:selenocysteine-specific translation elongation factor [Gemmatimonadota bacterium]
MIIGTAGHVDHGKSALVQALTGCPMDPLPDERRRGITLDLHVVPYGLRDGMVAGIVDVPGHEDLVRTMIAGAAGIDLVLLVVAANEGIMPQTREHLIVLEELGVARGIPVLSKADLVDREWLDLVASDLRATLGASPIPFAEPVACSARTGAGLDQLRDAIEAAGHGPATRDDKDLSRLPIDRVLSIPGAGTVLTGTVGSGSFRAGDAVRLLPSGLEGRIRTVQRHGASAIVVRRGERAAIAVAGIEAGSIHRGEVAVRPDQGWEAASMIDAAMRLSPQSPVALTDRIRLRVCLGTTEVIGRFRAVTPIQPGERGTGRIMLESPLVARGGDRFVLRSYSSVRVIGGGTVLDSRPPRGRNRLAADLGGDQPHQRLSLVVSRHPEGIPADEVAIRAGISLHDLASVAARSGAILDGETLLSSAALADAESEAMRVVREYHAANPTSAGMPLETFRAALRHWGHAAHLAVERLRTDGSLVPAAGVMAARGFVPEAATKDAAVARLVEAVSAAGLAVGTVSELERQTGVSGAAAALRAAEREGKVVAIGHDRFVMRQALDLFEARLTDLAGRGPITPGNLRDVTGLSRKHLIPLLEWADRTGLTIRREEGRVPGPRLGQPRS